MLQNSWVADLLEAYQEGLSSMELISSEVYFFALYRHVESNWLMFRSKYVASVFNSSTVLIPLIIFNSLRSINQVYAL
jgi:hypothetical protein